MKKLTHVLILAALLSAGLTACHSKTNGNTGTDSTSTMSGGNSTDSGMTTDTAKGSDSTQMKDSTKH